MTIRKITIPTMNLLNSLTHISIMIKNILIIHGWESNPDEHWYQGAKASFEKQGFKVFVPEMPGGYFPKLDKWLEIITNLNPDESWALIGHSLGGVAILKYLEKSSQKIGQVILIATPSDAMNMGAITNFFENGFDFTKIKSKCSKFDLIYEDNDVVVPLEHCFKFENTLKCPTHILKGYSHVRHIDLELLSSLIVK